jgi:nicotinamidase-related amidase
LSGGGSRQSRAQPVPAGDEPTESLDAATERLVFDGLRRFRQGRTTLLITHEGTHAGSYFRPGSTGYLAKDAARELPGEAVIVKRVNSAFIGTDLEARLRAAGIRTLVICGVTTNHCVETTARMAGNYGFEAWLVRDATWTFERLGPDGERHSADDVHAMTLANLHEEFARITMTAGVIGWLPPP